MFLSRQIFQSVSWETHVNNMLGRGMQKEDVVRVKGENTDCVVWQRRCRTESTSSVITGTVARMEWECVRTQSGKEATWQPNDIHCV